MSGNIEYYCPKRDEIENGPLAKDQVHEDLPHCFHNYPEYDDIEPSMICCFCGDLFMVDEHHAKVHGPYAPKIDQESVNQLKINQEVVKPTKKRSRRRGQEKSS